MTNERGLYDKYRVERIDGKPVGWCFVLEDKDPLTPYTLIAYAAAARRHGKVELAYDLLERVMELGYDKEKET